MNESSSRDDQGLFDRVLASRSVLVCVGPGGVGKTTTSAAIALRAAMQGRRVLVLTVDPARRLADSLGIEGLLPEPTRVDLSPIGGGEAQGGELWAMMLDTKRTWDQVIERYAPSADVREKIVTHPFYVQLSTALAGSQEYMAMEKLYELRQEGGWDLLVLDTPPTQHALDFLDAPGRMEDFFDSPTLRTLVRSGASVRKFGASLFRLNTLILKGVGRFIGADVFLRILEFLEAVASMSAGFAERARLVRAMFRESDVGFLVVSGPEQLSMREGTYFHERLRVEGMPLAGVILNRVRTSFGVGGEPEDELAQWLAQELWEQEPVRLHPHGRVLHLATEMARSAHRFETLSRADARAAQELRASLGPDVLMAIVPYFSRDIHDLVTLGAFADQVGQARLPVMGSPSS